MYLNHVNTIYSQNKENGWVAQVKERYLIWRRKQSERSQKSKLKKSVSSKKMVLFFQVLHSLRDVLIPFRSIAKFPTYARIAHAM